MLGGAGGQMWRESQTQVRPQWLPGTGGGPGRLLGGGGHSTVVTSTAPEAGPGSDSCRLERKDSLSDGGRL